MINRLLGIPSCPRFYLALFLVALYLLKCNLVLAQNVNQYSVNDIIANASGPSPTQARIKAIASGQRNAFLILLDRLGIDEKIASTLEDSAIADMVSSQQIMNEKITSNTYSATLNLTFSESFVKHYLNKKTSINTAGEEKKDPAKASVYLVLPVKLVKNNLLVWENDNDWKAAWANILKNNKISNIKLPRGDAGEVANINSQNTLSPNFADFEPLLNKYKADVIMLAYFDFDSIENKVNITLKAVQKSSLTQTRLDFVNVNQLGAEDLVAKVADKTVNYIANLGKEINKDSSNLAASQASQLPVNQPAPATGQNYQNQIVAYQIDVLISGLEDWLKVKNKLENSNLVSQFNVNTISRDLVKINVTYNNNNGDIISFFARNNLLLQKKPEGGYFLSLTKTPQ